MRLHDLRPVGLEHGRIEHGPEASTVEAGPRTDAFSSPDGSPGKDCLVGLRLPVEGNRWAVSVRVVPGFMATFDAGAMMLRTDGASWAKLAYERGPDGRTMAVSVVTRGLSDDANGPIFAEPALVLRASCSGTALAFHVSTDGRHWDLTRFFALPDRVTSIDLIAQSPMGDGCRVVFSDLRILDQPPADMRDGS